MKYILILCVLVYADTASYVVGYVNRHISNRIDTVFVMGYIDGQHSDVVVSHWEIALLGMGFNVVSRTKIATLLQNRSLEEILNDSYEIGEMTSAGGIVVVDADLVGDRHIEIMSIIKLQTSEIAFSGGLNIDGKNKYTGVFRGKLINEYTKGFNGYGVNRNPVLSPNMLAEMDSIANAPLTFSPEFIKKMTAPVEVEGPMQVEGPKELP